MLAWGIDGMAPTWLGKVSERYRSPQNAILVTGVLATLILAIYCFTDWIRFLQGFAGMGVVFTITTLAAALFPFYKRDVYEASPAKVEIAGIPLLTLCGIPGSLGLGYITYRVIVDSAYGANSPISMAMFVLVFVVAAVWYFVARAYRRRQGVNMNARFEEIPVE
jgi:amino acid transporter